MLAFRFIADADDSPLAAVKLFSLFVQVFDDCSSVLHAFAV